MNKSPSSNKALEGIVSLFEYPESLEAIISNIMFSLIQTVEFIKEENNISIPRVFGEIIHEMKSG